MTLSSDQLNQDWQRSSPFAHAVAQEWVAATYQLKGIAPSAADLADRITGVGYDLTMQGAPEIEIDLMDENWELLDSGFFDPANKGTLDRIDINFPQGSKYRWRLFQFSPRGDYTIQTYWVPRVVTDMMNLNAKHNPLQASRGRRTRAEFIRSAFQRAAPYATFHSAQLDTVQKVGALTIPTSGTSLKSATKTFKGISTSAMNASNLTVKGQPMGDRQRQQANILLRVADKLGAGKVATEAIIYAGIWESNLEIYSTTGAYWGVLAGKVGIWSQSDTSGMATAFLLGNSAKGYQGGGAIALSATINNPIEIAVKVEVPSIWPINAYALESGYPGNAQALAEVDAIIEAGGGATGTGGVSGAPVEPVQAYNFQIGTTANPFEDYWTAVNRLAQEVNWEIVIDGDDVYYDSDVTLCRGQIAAVIDRHDEAVTANWSYDWDRTHLPTNFQLEVECDPLEFVPADVIKLTNFGPASAGSSIHLPGRWLLGETVRRPGDIVETLTLVQPTKPLPEPAPTVGTAPVKPGKIKLTGKGVNPFTEATNLVAGRVDDGKDYSMAPGSPILAPFDSMCLGTRVANWYAGQPLIGFQIVGGTYNGWCYYFAEQISPVTFKSNQIIKAGTTIAHYASSGTGIECGLLDPVTKWKTLAQANGHGGEVPSPEGLRWQAILHALGAPV